MTAGKSAPETSLAELYPDGRTLYYEGDDPTEFRQQVITACGFDPDGTYVFHCPPEHLDAIEHGGWPIGT